MSCAKPVNKVDPLPWANPTDVKVSPQHLEASAPAIQTYVDRGIVSGITTLVARHGHLAHWESTGFRDLETQDPLDLNDIFRIYSMTKPVTSVAVMMLVEEGTLAIDGEPSSYLSDFSNVLVYEAGKQVPPEQPITIRHLLSYTSGITYGLRGNTPVDAMYREANVFSGDRANLADEVARLPLLAHPNSGTREIVSKAHITEKPKVRTSGPSKLGIKTLSSQFSWTVLLHSRSPFTSSQI